MEYKLFGTARQPPENFREDLAAFGRLDDAQRKTLTQWFLSSDDFWLYTPELPPVIAASTMLPEQFRQVAGIAKSLLFGWHARGLALDDLERDLLLLGVDSDQVGIFSNFLEPLSAVKERVWLESRKDFERLAGLPTVDDVNLIWNTRPVFGGDAFAYYNDDTVRASHDRLLGSVYLATMEISASDNNGNKQRVAIQIDERMFKLFLAGFERAANQLNVLKNAAGGPSSKREAL